MNIRTLIAKQCQNYILEKNDSTTRSRIVSDLSKLLNDSLGNRFEVICDETNNPPSVVDKNALRGLVREKTNSPNEIRYCFTLTPTNVTVSNDII